MGFRLGNVKFDEVYEHLGYELTDEDKKIWDKFHNNNANLDGMEQCFHVFAMPLCILFKGQQAKEAILKIFTADKLTNPKGEFQVLDRGE